MSWSRLLRGRFRDPLVGRSVLYGVALSTLVILFWGQVYVVIPHVLALLGGRYLLEALAAQALNAGLSAYGAFTASRPGRILTES